MENEDYNEWEDHITQFDHFDNGHVRSSCRTLRRNSTTSTIYKENSKEMGPSITMPHPGGSNGCLRSMSVSRRGAPQANLTPAPLHLPVQKMLRRRKSSNRRGSTQDYYSLEWRVRSGCMENALTVEALFTEVIRAWQSKSKTIMVSAGRKGAIVSVINVSVIIE
jgi:hypothetical protein